jgi:hypothetical protein
MLTQVVYREKPELLSQKLGLAIYFSHEHQAAEIEAEVISTRTPVA